MDLSGISDLDLSLLQRTFFEARFCAVENTPEVWRSPLIAGLHAEVIEEDRRRLEAAGQAGRLEDHREWLRWSEHVREREIVARKLTESWPGWLELADGDRAGFLARLVHPFVIEDGEMDEFLDEIDRIAAGTDDQR